MPSVIKPSNQHSIVATGWTNPSNAFSATGDNVYATTLNGSTTKNISASGDFGFANILSADIPDGSTIDEVRIRCEADLTATAPGALFGVIGRISGADSGSEATHTTVGEAEVVTTLSEVTLANLRSASTVVKARCRGAKGNSATAVTVRLDYVRLEVDWSTPTVVHDLTGSVSGVGSLDGTLAIVEEDGFDPADLDVTIAGTTAELTWSASPTPGVVDYQVFRRTPQTGDPFDPETDTPVATGITDEFYDDESLAPGDYDWQVFGRIPA